MLFLLFSNKLILGWTVFGPSSGLWRIVELDGHCGPSPDNWFCLIRLFLSIQNWLGVFVLLFKLYYWSLQIRPILRSYSIDWASTKLWALVWRAFGAIGSLCFKSTSYMLYSRCIILDAFNSIFLENWMLLAFTRVQNRGTFKVDRLLA